MTATVTNESGWQCIHTWYVAPSGEPSVTLMPVAGSTSMYCSQMQMGHDLSSTEWKEQVPAPRAGVATERWRDTVALTHSVGQGSHSDHSDMVQLWSPHKCVLQPRVSVCTRSHDAGSPWSRVRLRDCWPPPQRAEQVDHPP